MNRLLTPRELSDLIALARRTTLYSRRAAAGDLPRATLIEGRVRFKLSDVHRWMEYHKERSADYPGTSPKKGGNA